MTQLNENNLTPVEKAIKDLVDNHLTHRNVADVQCAEQFRISIENLVAAGPFPEVTNSKARHRAISPRSSI